MAIEYSQQIMTRVQWYFGRLPHVHPFPIDRYALWEAAFPGPLGQELAAAARHHAAPKGVLLHNIWNMGVEASGYVHFFLDPPGDDSRPFWVKYPNPCPIPSQKGGFYLIDEVRNLPSLNRWYDDSIALNEEVECLVSTLQIFSSYVTHGSQWWEFFPEVAASILPNRPRRIVKCPHARKWFDAHVTQEEIKRLTELLATAALLPDEAPNAGVQTL